MEETGADVPDGKKGNKKCGPNRTQDKLLHEAALKEEKSSSRCFPGKKVKEGKFRRFTVAEGGGSIT